MFIYRHLNWSQWSCRRLGKSIIGSLGDLSKSNTLLSLNNHDPSVMDDSFNNLLARGLKDI